MKRQQSKDKATSVYGGPMNRSSQWCLVLAAIALTPTLTSCGLFKKSGGAAAKAISFTSSNFDLSGMDLTGAGEFKVNDPNCTMSSEELLASCGNGAEVLKFKLFKQPNGSSVAVYVAQTIRIPAGTVLTMQGKNAVVLVALDKIEIDGGLVSAASGGGTPGAGGHAQQNENAQGGGPGGGGAGSASSSGGGGSYCGKGGAGALGKGKSGAAAKGGVVYGSPEIVPLVGGSSGGMGSVGEAGGGGGALQLVAGNAVSVQKGGYVHVGGGGGSFGGQPGQEAAGGGSGGSILIEAPQVTIAGALAANGGGGGSSSATGGTPTGDDATRDDKPAAPGKGVPSGGKGAAAAVVMGADGVGATEYSSGAGGGGAGRIRINTTTGSATVIGAILSPNASTPCMTQGKIALLDK